MTPLRWYSKRDIPAIRLILSQVGENWHDEKLMFYLTSSNHITMVGMAGEAVVGFMIYQLNPLKLVYIGVREDHRRQGVALTLIEKFKSKVCVRRQSAIVVASDDNLPLHLLLKKAGFKARPLKGKNSYEFSFVMPKEAVASIVDQVFAEGIMV